MNPMIYKRDLKLAQKRIIELEARVRDLENQIDSRSGKIRSRKEVANGRHIK